METLPEPEPDRVPPKGWLLFGIAEPDTFLDGLTLGWGTENVDEIIRRELDGEPPF